MSTSAFSLCEMAAYTAATKKEYTILYKQFIFTGVQLITMAIFMCTLEVTVQSIY